MNKPVAEVASVLQRYPPAIVKKIKFLRQLVLSTAKEEFAGALAIEETLKWGEPSYLTRQGSTLRLGWKASRPLEYAMLFNC